MSNWLITGPEAEFYEHGNDSKIYNKNNREFLLPARKIATCSKEDSVNWLFIVSQRLAMLQLILILQHTGIWR
jgi:hypothetical protein